MRSIWFIITSGLFLVACSTPPHVILYVPENDSKCYQISVKGEPLSSRNGYYEHVITKKEIEALVASPPVLMFEREGYLPYEAQLAQTSLDDVFWKNAQPVLGNKINHFEYVSAEGLIKDPNYPGPQEKLKVSFTLNSEPQGAKVYEGENLIGVTPITNRAYALESGHYESGTFISTKLTLIKQGYDPKEYRISFDVDADWKYRCDKEPIKKVFIVPLQPKASAAYLGVDSYSGSLNCENAKRDYTQAEAAYDIANRTRERGRGESVAAGIIALGSDSEDPTMGIFSKEASVAVDEMNRALQLMQDAKGRASKYCGD